MCALPISFTLSHWPRVEEGWAGSPLELSTERQGALDPGWGLEDRGQGLGSKKSLALETLSFKGGPGELKGRPRLPGAPINKEQAGPRIFQIDLPGKWAWGAGVGLTLLHTPARVTSERSACIATTPPTTALVRW